RPILDPHLVRIIDVDGSAVGFLMMIPDLNQVVSRSGRLTTPLLARLLLKRDGRIPGVDTAVVVMIGAAQSRFGAGIGRVIAGEMADIIAASRYRQVATTWVHEDNRWSKALVAQMNSQPTKRYRVYEKAVA
ncbi:MAG TPA: N-acetyltransferase, partial [Mycobacterium sp.]|nr:N-acetyltransferase [Mycobacterium sp.]